MNNELELNTSIDIRGDKDLVWDALTNPQKISVYLHGTTTTTDWKPGSPLTFEGEYKGKHYKDLGTKISNKPLELLEYKYWSGFSGLENKPENYSNVRFQITGNNPCKLTITQRGFVNEEARDHSKKAWQDALEKIKHLCEDKAL